MNSLARNVQKCSKMNCISAFENKIVCLKSIDENLKCQRGILEVKSCPKMKTLRATVQGGDADGAGGGKRGLGTDIAVLSSMVFLAQFTLSAVVGLAVHVTGTTRHGHIPWGIQRGSKDYILNLPCGWRTPAPGGCPGLGGLLGLYVIAYLQQYLTGPPGYAMIYGPSNQDGHGRGVGLLGARRLLGIEGLVLGLVTSSWQKKIIRCEEHLYTRLRPSVRRSVGWSVPHDAITWKTSYVAIALRRGGGRGN
jgi:hypothetical protein